MFRKSHGLLASLIVVAAILPIILVATLSEDLRLRTFADQGPELRIWTEPAEVVTKPDKSFMVTIYGETKTTEDLIPEVSFALNLPAQIKAVPERIEYSGAFSGRMKLGEVNLTALEEGEFKVGILESAVDTKVANLRVVTAGVTVVSRKP